MTPNHSPKQEQIYQEPGICPICGSGALVYEASGPQGEGYFYDWHCLDCDAQGKEWYDLVFAGHTVKGGHES